MVHWRLAGLSYAAASLNVSLYSFPGRVVVELDVRIVSFMSIKYGSAERNKIVCNLAEVTEGWMLS